MEVKRLVVDDYHDEVQVWSDNGSFVGAGACYKTTPTDDVVRKVIAIATGLPL